MCGMLSYSVARFQMSFVTPLQTTTNNESVYLNGQKWSQCMMNANRKESQTGLTISLLINEQILLAFYTLIKR